MLRLAGIPLMDDDVRTLIDLWMRSGRAEDIFAATAIQAALSRGSASHAYFLNGGRFSVSSMIHPRDSHSFGASCFAI